MARLIICNNLPTDRSLVEDGKSTEMIRVNGKNNGGWCGVSDLWFLILV